MKKLCGICQQKKHPSQFNKNKNTKDGLQTECRACKKYRYVSNRPCPQKIKNMNGEVWNKIPGINNYQVSSFGRIKSIKRIEKRKDGRVFFYHDKIIKLTKNIRSGYLSFTAGLNGKRLYAHRCVALAFIANKENKPCVNHKNGIKKDNKVENLEWVTHSENMRSAYSIGLKMGHRNSLISKINSPLNQIRL